MAVVLIDGFDVYNGTGANTGLRGAWTQVDITTFAMATGRFSGQCVTVTPSGNRNYLIKRTIASTTSFSCGFAFRAATVGSHSPGTLLMFGASGATPQVGLFLNSSGKLELRRITDLFGAGTTLGTMTGALADNTWYYIETECTISDTVGVFNLYVNGGSQLSLSSQDTRNGTPTDVDTFGIGAGNSSTLSGSLPGVLSFDDLYITNGVTRLGERRVETLYPTSDVAQGFSRSTGATNFSLVDEATANGDTDYVQASSVGTVDTYGFGDLTGTPGTIDAVQLSAFAEKTDATSRSIALQAISGATTSDGANFSLAAASYGKFERLMLTDPNGSIAWTAANVNALTGGPKVTV